MTTEEFEDYFILDQGNIDDSKSEEVQKSHKDRVKDGR